MKITYILSILSAAEAKKKKTLRKPKTQILKLDSDEPWDCMKAQLLVKLDETIQPSNISFSLFDFSFHIPRVVSKPGLSLCEEPDYTMMTAKALTSRDHTVNIVIEQLPLETDKENTIDEAETSGAKKKKAVSQVQSRS